MTKIIAGFPGIGKSIFTTCSRELGLSVLDSDSSMFSWLEKGVRHPDFPNNYMEHIRSNIGKVDYILVSSHDIVRQALKDSGIHYTLVYPSRELKKEYLVRYSNRGNDDRFILFIDSNWDNFILDIEREDFPTLVKLQKGQFLSDVLVDSLTTLQSEEEL